MKKSGWVVIILLLALIGVSYWLLRGSDADHLARQEIVVDVPDIFEK